LIKVVLLVLPLLVAAVSCASVPHHTGEVRHVDSPDSGFPAGESPDLNLFSGDSRDVNPPAGDSPEGFLAAGHFPESGFAAAESPENDLHPGDSPVGALVSGDSPEGVLPSGTSPVDALSAVDLPADVLLSVAPPEGDLPVVDALYGTPGYASAPVPDEAHAFPEVIIAEVPSLESDWIAGLAEPVAPVFDPDPVLLAIAPDLGPGPVLGTSINPGPEPVSPIAIRESPAFVAQAVPPAQPPVQVPAPVGEPPAVAPPIAPPEPPAATPPPPVAPPPVAAWEPPFFAPELPELPNPVSDFRNLLPPPIVFSRVVYVTEGQAVEVPFRGSGWIFLGETDGRRGISFDTRRPDSEGQTFVFRAETEGEYALRFYRRDFIRDIILNDHVRVVIADTDSAGLPVRPGRAVAERWPSPVDEARVLRAAGRQIPPDAEDDPSGAPPLIVTPEPTPAIPEAVAAAVPEAPGTMPPAGAPPQPAVPPVVPAPQPAVPAIATPVAPAVPEIVPVVEPAVVAAMPPQWPPVIGYPYELLQMAREEFDAGRVAEAIGLIDLFRELHPSGSDEAWWLLGQFFEADSPSRNILNAISYYRRLVSEFPQSSRLTDARRRIAFLERFFINIR